MIALKPILKGIENHKYQIRLAHTEEEVDRAMELRYRIFGEELGRKFSFQGKRDRDKYDAQCHHLLVIQKESNEIVGTYRLQRYEQALEGYGFVSEKRFHLNELPEEILENAFEVGRVCIDDHHRNGRVLYLLWKGLAAYLKHYNLRYLFGYSALDKGDESNAEATYRLLEREGYIDHEHFIDVNAPYRIEAPVPVTQLPEPTIPPLFRNYLDVGTRVCSQPAYDPDLTIAYFFILLDIETITDRTRKMFFG